MRNIKQTKEVTQLRSLALSFAHFRLSSTCDGEIWYADGHNGMRLCVRIGFNSIDFFAFDRNNDYFNGESKKNCLGFDGSDEKRKSVVKLKQLVGVP